MARIIYNNVIPFKGYKAMAAFPFVFVRKEYKDDNMNIVLNHEYVHHSQQKEMMFVGLVVAIILFAVGCGWWSSLAVPSFYWWYIAEYFIRFVAYGFSHQEAYRNISFEQEAYSHQGEESYIENRKHFGWLRYIPEKMYSRWPSK